ncbi:xanthine dehydrogenase family protein subunit M [Nonomuraea sp. NN258]|uniref:FAD binding domain-containing protein n=1 Tax=Nonomuraea antri TaxID=2730852 RepID=UPI00156A42C3|nr:FAD binding domain-containing protein [Nonomuraea antri]NRQ30559.1 xanthine dehydrogenase family protein subunit M [Nonomuraea antri]
MKPPPFEYHAPRDLGDALRVLAEVRGKVLAGGQSLIPMLNMRLAAPAHLVDVNRLGVLAAMDASAAGVRVGALVRHAQAERSWAHPLLSRALRLVAHPVIRNRGTVVGSLVHADPAAELPAVLALLDGSVTVARWGGPGGPTQGGGPAPVTAGAGGPGGDGLVAVPAGATLREIPAHAFFTGPMESAVEPGELAVSAFFPALGARTGSAFHEVARRHGDYALAGVCAVASLDGDGAVATARVACVGVGPVPVVVDVTAECAGRPPSETRWARAARAVQERIEPEADIHATAAYRRHLVGVLTERALREAAEGGAAGGA